MARSVSVLLLALGLLLGLGVEPTSAHPARVVQPHQTYAGKTYGEWSAAWWQWAANISEPASPVDDPSGHNCAVDQRGPVWFLAGTADGTPATRRCTIPAGKAILIPILDTECSTIEGNGDTVAELRGCARATLTGATQLRVTVDGRALPLGPGANRFRFGSPPFQITFAPQNAFYPAGDVSGRSKAVADGYWILLRPLKAGMHRIVFHALLPSFDFEIAVRYDLTVLPAA